LLTIECMRSVIATVAVVACGSRTPSPAPIQPWQMTGGLEHAMMNCPSAVAGAATRFELTPTGIDLIVTAADRSARDEIIELAAYHARLGGGPTEWPEHSGHHGGPGTVGHCPVIHDRTMIALSPRPDGVTLHVTTTLPGHVKDVQDATVNRLERLPRWLPH
jgi:hypothetical protein